jgi:STE24 endopeptidase
VSVRGWAALALAAILVALLVVAVVRWPRGLPVAPRTEQLAALGSLPPEQVARARAYRRAARWPGYASMLLGLLVVLLLGLTPAGAMLADRLASPFGGHWLAAAVLGGLAVVLAGQLAVLPLSAWRHRIAVRYGLSRQTWGAWLRDLLKAYAVTTVLVSAAVAGLFTLTRLLPRWWWMAAAAGAAAVVILLSFVFPVIVEPLFARFAPMPSGPLRTALTELAGRAGVPVREVLVADASRRTAAANAYVSGLGPTRRIVVFDTLVESAPPPEVVGVVAHELAHARHRDVAGGTALAALGAAAMVTGLYLVGQWEALLRLGGVGSIAEPRAIALIVAVLALAGVALGPVQALVSRRVEARADAQAVRLTGDPDTFSAMHARLAMTNLADPDPPRWQHLLASSHPSTVERIAAVRAAARERR